jgi:hypothetical protein
MYAQPQSPIKEVTFGEGMKISLNNYYDILKEQAGGLGAKEFLQLKLVADGVDISSTTEPGSYKWFSYYNLLRRSDLAIDPSPVSDTVLTGAEELHNIYGKFLKRLRSLVVLKELSQEEQVKLAAIDLEIDRNNTIARDLFKKDMQEWKEYCEIRGINSGDISTYVQWSSRFGQMRQIEEINRKNILKIYERTTILNRTFPNPDDQQIVEAEAKFDDPASRLCYPIHPDYEYSIKLTAEYLATLPHASTALFDDRLVMTWDKTLDFIKTANQGSVVAEFSRQTGDSNSIVTDWNHSGSVGWGFIKVNASASEHKEISEDFNKATGLKLSAESIMRVNINYGPWFSPHLFQNARVAANPEMFKDFFGDNGSLLYYPTALILIRGFGITFNASSDWTFDYKSRFSASAGGGFSVFGINFGGSSSYSRSVSEHQVDKTATQLTIADDKKTIRFVGYVVKKNDFLTTPAVAHLNAMGVM